MKTIHALKLDDKLGTCKWPIKFLSNFVTSQDGTRWKATRSMIRMGLHGPSEFVACQDKKLYEVW